MDDSVKHEILTAIDASQEETRTLINRVIDDHVIMRAKIDRLDADVVALKARGVAWDAADAGHSRELTDGLAANKRIADEAAAAAARTLEAAARAHNVLAGAVVRVDEKIDKVSTDVTTQVRGALIGEVSRIEEAADKLTHTPQVRTAAAIGGVFAGSAFVAIVIAIIDHL